MIPFIKHSQNEKIIQMEKRLMTAAGGKCVDSLRKIFDLYIQNAPVSVSE